MKIILLESKYIIYKTVSKVISKHIKLKKIFAEKRNYILINVSERIYEKEI